MSRKALLYSRFFLTLFLLLGLGCNEVTQDTVLDKDLSNLISIYDLRPLDTKELVETERFKLGRALFFDRILSGNHDVACATCHLASRGLSDGRPISLGVRGTKLGPARHYTLAPKEIHPRNSQDLWNRDHNDVSSMFWDGRVEMVDPVNRIFRSPLGDRLPDGLDNAMAAQALFPLITPNEMLGYPGDNYAGFNNELPAMLNPVTLKGSDEVFSAIMERLIGTPSSPPRQPHQAVYRDMFQKAFPKKQISEMSIVDVANALAHFEELAFATRESRWDRYLVGESTALTTNEKAGAELFFGKARCVACHNGETFSDFNFHSIGVIDEDWRIEQDKRDLGRFYATKDPKDAFKFRTPPLRNVSKSAPYFHNGSESDLKTAISKHLSSTRNQNKYHSSGRFLMTAQQLRAISPILTSGIVLSDRELTLLVQFLNTLESEFDTEELATIVPTGVPSKLKVEYQ